MFFFFFIPFTVMVGASRPQSRRPISHCVEKSVLKLWVLLNFCRMPQGLSKGSTSTLALGSLDLAHGPTDPEPSTPSPHCHRSALPRAPHTSTTQVTGTVPPET